MAVSNSVPLTPSLAMEATTRSSTNERPTSSLIGPSDIKGLWPGDICQQCRRMFSGIYEGQSGPHHPSSGSLAQSVLEECYICCYLWNEARKNLNFTADSTSSPYTEFKVKPGWHSESRYLHLTLAGSSEVINFLLFPSSSFAKPGVDILANQALEISTNLAESTESKSTWNLICHWLETCNPQSHPKCHQAYSASQLMPSRLLDVNHPKGVRLVSFLDSDQLAARYVTLSHTWGHARIFTLTHKTASQLFAGIDESVLALSFRDAINITRKLGVQYLWIDSLCIYQDDFSDWRSEASHMADVYTGSYCNLAATAASDSAKGFFSKSNTHVADRRWAEARKIPTTWESKNNSDIMHPGEYHVSVYKVWSNGMTSQPLLKRGWVVQERMLAPRTIHFSQPQVFWECHHRIACETYPNRLPADVGVFKDLSLLWKQAHYKPPSISSQYYSSLERPPLVSVYSYYLDDQPVDQWQALVEAFSVCKLTMERDKLPAMSGIAKKIAREGSRGRYFAGLWETDFERQLLWFVLFETETIKRPAEYRAPSWSWASLDAEISHFTMPRGTLVNISLLSADTFPDENNQDSQENPAGRFTIPHWYARLTAPLHTAITTKSPGDVPVSQHSVQILGTLLDLTAMIHWDTPSPPQEARVWILPIWYYLYEEDLPVCRGLVLNAVPTSERGSYERLGMLVMDMNSTEDLETVIYGRGMLAKQDYEEHVCNKNGQGKEHHLYTFTIV